MASAPTVFELTDQMFAEIGRAITAWSHVEQTLFGVYQVCAGTSTKTHAGSVVHIDHDITSAVFYSLETLHAKRTILNAAVSAYVRGVPQEAELLLAWDKLSQKARELSRKRNKLAHWTVWEAQHIGKGTEDEPIRPARLLPPAGSPSFWREFHPNPTGRYLTVGQVGHIYKAFQLYASKVRCFEKALIDTEELHDKDVRRALDLLHHHQQLSQMRRG